MSAPRWSALVERALERGEHVQTVAPSAFLLDVLEDLTHRATTNGGVTFCPHLPTEALRGGYPDMIAFPALAEVACGPCARLVRDDLASRRRRTCERCDAARASALHRVDVGAEPGQVLLVLAVALCEPCATEEGLREPTPELR